MTEARTVDEAYSSAGNTASARGAVNKTHIPEVTKAVIASMRDVDDSYVLILANGAVLDGVFAPFQLEAVMGQMGRRADAVDVGGWRLFGDFELMPSTVGKWIAEGPTIRADRSMFEQGEAI